MYAMRSRLHSAGAAKCMAAVAIVVLSVVGCDDDIVGSDQFTASQDFSETVDGTGNTKLLLAGINGNVQITAASTDEFTVMGVRRVSSSDSQADAAEHLDDLQVIVFDSANAVVVRTEQPSESNGRNYVVDYKVTIPLDTEVQAAAVNGDVTVLDAGADIQVVNVNGNIDLHDIAGNVAAGNVNGNITARVTLPAGGSVEMATVNGNVRLDVPTSTSALVMAVLDNGSISSTNLDFSDVETTDTKFSGRLGVGDGDITLATVNGNIQIVGF